MDSGFITAGDSEIYYESHGSGPAILFIHAGVADARMWRDQLHIDGYRSIVYDQRGFGRSDLGSETFTSHDDARAVLDHLRVDGATVVGCSRGAGTALHLASASPDRIDGLVLVGSGAPGFDPDIDYESPEWPEAIEAFERGDLQRVAELDAEVWLAGVGRSTSELEQGLVDLFIEMDLIALRNEENRDELDTTTALVRPPELDSPVLAIVGVHDLPQIRAAAHHLAETMSDRPAVVLPDSAHLPSLEQPEAFNTVLQEFLSKM